MNTERVSARPLDTVTLENGSFRRVLFTGFRDGEAVVVPAGAWHNVILHALRAATWTATRRQTAARLAGIGTRTVEEFATAITWTRVREVPMDRSVCSRRTRS